MLLKPAHQPAHASIVPRDLSGGGIEALAWKKSVAFHKVANHEEWRKGVGELQDACRANEALQVADLRNCGRDDEGDAPVDGHDGDESQLAAAKGEVREAKEVDEEGIVDDLHTNIAVEQGGDEASHELDAVDGSLPVVGRHALIGRVERVLALVRVDE